MRAAQWQLPAAPRAERLSRRWDVFLGALVLMLGLAYVTSALVASDASGREAADRFVPVTAYVDGAEVIAVPPTPPLPPAYSVRVHCRYPWIGQEFVTSTDAYSDGAPRLGYGDAVDQAAALRPGSPVRVFIDPRDPQYVVLDNRVPHSVLPIVLMVALTGASAFLALIGWRGWPLFGDSLRRG